ncbi:uncharacterized protein BP01DRAFT_353112 [Aspergillus saccharolyticus JOP 1030-1]|uniref:Uncharacterized protein n=1 Tax=Aspergillus saccharolyticus JOP 1030-1 TaxID=1450539 RepID=A0A318ZXI1_9EURO|nr:hypothetical protein BP01DRAFT_353112 [Aspergillus saccharolyticus JOP 1030-1]PYH48810.1 hypothetical protein BP01DRAFT_353112 [Aspergillus saccharolyticus JOP 1030-1]
MMEERMRNSTIPMLNGDINGGCRKTIHLQIGVSDARPCVTGNQPLLLSQHMRKAWAVILSKYIGSSTVAFGVYMSEATSSQYRASIEQWRIRDEQHLSMQEAVRCIASEQCQDGKFDPRSMPGTCLSLQWTEQDEISGQELLEPLAPFLSVGARAHLYSSSH